MIVSQVVFLCLECLFIGWLLGETTAMRRERLHQDELRRIRAEGR